MSRRLKRIPIEFFFKSFYFLNNRKLAHFLLQICTKSWLIFKVFGIHLAKKYFLLYQIRISTKSVIRNNEEIKKKGQLCLEFYEIIYST